MTQQAGAIDESDGTIIRDAACVVVVDRRQVQPRVLMGRRHADQVFLPNKWVFPGGRLDDDDRRLAADPAFDYAPRDLAPEIRPFALAGIRELAEETGLMIGKKTQSPSAAGGAWGPFAAAGHTPSPAALTPLARALTPPGRVRRYDTWFFIAERTSVSEVTISADGELLDLEWFDIGSARRLDLPKITRLVLEDVSAQLPEKPDFPGAKVPLYLPHEGGFRRDLIATAVTVSLP